MGILMVKDHGNPLDDQLMEDRKNVVHKPVKHQAGGKIVESKAKDDRHEIHNFFLAGRGSRLGSQFLLPQHRTDH